MDVLVGIPVLVVSLITQTVVIRSLPLLHGTADIVLLVLIAWALHERVTAVWEWTVIAGLLVSFVSAMPLMSPLVEYLIIVGITRIFHARVWQMPILAMIIATIVGTIIQHIYIMIVLQLVNGVSIPVAESMNQVIFPSVLLNLLLAIPVYAFVTDMANSIYRVQVEE